MIHKHLDDPCFHAADPMYKPTITQPLTRLSTDAAPRIRGVNMQLRRLRAAITTAKPPAGSLPRVSD